MTIRGIEVTVKDASATVLRGTVDGAGDTIVVRTSNDVIGMTGIPQGVGGLSPFDSRRISKMLYPVSAHLRMNGGDGGGR